MIYACQKGKKMGGGSPTSFWRVHASKNTLRPVPNVVLLPCRTPIKLSFRFMHGRSTPFETMKRGTAELGSARLLSTASLAVPHGSSTPFETIKSGTAELGSARLLSTASLAVPHGTLGNLSTRVFETRTATGSELFSLLTCPHTTTFTLPSIFSPLEMNSIKIWETIRSKNANCSLPVAVRVSKTRVLKLPFIA